MDHLLESIYVSKALYHRMLLPLCSGHELTLTEALVLLSLANHPKKDTATDIVEEQHLTKSSVSNAVRALQERGMILGKYTNGNHRSIHLEICDTADKIVKEGLDIQKSFLGVLTAGFSDEEIAALDDYCNRLISNISGYDENDQDVQSPLGL